MMRQWLAYLLPLGVVVWFARRRCERVTVSRVDYVTATRDVLVRL
jgi:hypothetical protein